MLPFHNPKHPSTAPFEAVLARDGFFSAHSDPVSKASHLRIFRIFASSINRPIPLFCRTMSERTIHVSNDIAGVAIVAAELIVESAAKAIASRGVFSLVLAGGSTPRALYELLTADAYYSRIDWTRCEIYFGDERCVPPVSKESNYRMAREALLDHVPITAGHVHRMRGEIEPQQAAIEYDQLLSANFADSGADVTLLGMGDDGHTASLFPGTEALRESQRRCVANFVPKLGAWRLTMSAAFLNRSREVIVMVAGAEKAARVAEVLEGPRSPEALPIQSIEAASGSLHWLMDAAAAGMNDLED